MQLEPDEHHPPLPFIRLAWAEVYAAEIAIPETTRERTTAIVFMMIPRKIGCAKTRPSSRRFIDWATAKFDPEGKTGRRPNARNTGLISFKKWCCQTGLNCRPLHYQWSALPLSYGSMPRNENRPEGPSRRGDPCHMGRVRASAGSRCEGSKRGPFGP